MSFESFLRATLTTAYPEPVEEPVSRLVETMVGTVHQISGLPPGSLVWDIGCGQAVAKSFFDAKGWIGRGIAYTEADVDACEAIGYPCDLADMHSVKVTPGIYDLLWCRHVLEHSPAPGYVLWRLLPALRPGGWVYVEVPAPGTVCRHEANPDHRSVLTDLGWRALLERAGVTNLRHTALDIPTGAGPDTYYAYIGQVA